VALLPGSILFARPLRKASPRRRHHRRLHAAPKPRSVAARLRSVPPPPVRAGSTPVGNTTNDPGAQHARRYPDHREITAGVGHRPHRWGSLLWSRGPSGEAPGS